MSNVKEMFLKAAEFQLIHNPSIGFLEQLELLGYRIRVRGEEYGSYMLSRNGFTESDIQYARELFAEEALDIILRRDGVHA